MIIEEGKSINQCCLECGQYEKKLCTGTTLSAYSNCVYKSKNLGKLNPLCNICVYYNVDCNGSTLHPTECCCWQTKLSTYVREIDGKYYAYAQESLRHHVYQIGSDVKDGVRKFADITNEGILSIISPSDNYKDAAEKAVRAGFYRGCYYDR